MRPGSSVARPSRWAYAGHVSRPRCADTHPRRWLVRGPDVAVEAGVGQPHLWLSCPGGRWRRSTGGGSHPRSRSARPPSGAAAGLRPGGHGPRVAPGAAGHRPPRLRHFSRCRPTSSATGQGRPSTRRSPVPGANPHRHRPTPRRASSLSRSRFGWSGWTVKRMKGLEPSTFCMASRRSSQLSYIRANPEYSGRLTAATPGEGEAARARRVGRRARTPGWPTCRTSSGPRR